MQAFRTAQFLGLGSVQFTRRGYLTRERQFTPGALDCDLTGRNFIVTGANSGLGKATALALAQRGGNVHMVCRDRGRGETALATVKDVAANPSSVHLHICDLSSLKDIEEFAEEWTAKGPKPLDCLINNAGLMVHQRTETTDGVELNFGVNVLGTYCLTELLLPSLKAASAPRVVTVSSGGALLSGREALQPGKCTGDDLVTPWGSDDGASDDDIKKKRIDGELAYSRNKRCQIALTEHWAAKYKSAGIFWAVMHPGWSSTSGLKEAMPEFHKFFNSALRTVDEGADTICWLAFSEEAAKYGSGNFFLDRTVVPKYFWLSRTKYRPSDLTSLVTYLKELALEKANIAIA